MSEIKSELLWAAAKQNGGELRISKDCIKQANENGAMITMIDDRDAQEFVVKVIKKSNIKRIDIIGQNGNDGDHYDSE